MVWPQFPFPLWLRFGVPKFCPPSTAVIQPRNSLFIPLCLPFSASIKCPWTAETSLVWFEVSNGNTHPKERSYLFDIVWLTSIQPYYQCLALVNLNVSVGETQTFMEQTEHTQRLSNEMRLHRPCPNRLKLGRIDLDTTRIRGNSWLTTQSWVQNSRCASLSHYGWYSAQNVSTSNKCQVEFVSEVEAAQAFGWVFLLAQ